MLAGNIVTLRSPCLSLESKNGSDKDTPLNSVTSRRKNQVVFLQRNLQDKLYWIVRRCRENFNFLGDLIREI